MNLSFITRILFTFYESIVYLYSLESSESLSSITELSHE
jgi:hypothetical protein